MTWRLAFLSLALVQPALGCTSSDTAETGLGGATATTSASDGGAGGGGTGGEAAQGGAGGAGGGLTCHGPAWPSNDACEACENEKCCITGSNCAADADCVAIMDCKVSGGADCTAGHSKGIWNYSGLVVCLENVCASECGVAPAKCGGIEPTPASCTDEVQAQCCDETAGCGASDACLAFVYQCIDQNECTEMACFAECRAKYPDSADPFDTMANCWAKVPCL